MRCALSLHWYWTFRPEINSNCGCAAIIFLHFVPRISGFLTITGNLKGSMKRTGVAVKPDLHQARYKTIKMSSATRKLSVCCRWACQVHFGFLFWWETNCREPYRSLKLSKSTGGVREFFQPFVMTSCEETNKQCIPNRKLIMGPDLTKPYHKFRGKFLIKEMSVPFVLCHFTTHSRKLIMGPDVNKTLPQIQG